MNRYLILSVAGAFTQSISSLAACLPGEISGTFSNRGATSDGGYAYLITPPSSFPVPSDTANEPSRSPLRLFENGVELGAAHSVHDDIRNLGRGRFSFKNGSLRLSASDNGNVRRNGRRYTYCAAVDAAAAVVPATTTASAPVVAPSPSPTPAAVSSASGYEALLNEEVGFGKNTTGGKGGTLYTVTSLADSGAGTLREAVSKSGPVWIRFAVSGTIALQTELKPKSDKTIDGRGADITITANGISVEEGASNVIIAYLKIRDTLDDAIRLYNGGNRLWVHHCDISNTGDGAIDTTEGVTDITVSYVHIFNVDKAMLIGASSDDGNGSNLLWTAHHNWFDHVVQRLPFVRFGKAHSFNNLISWYNGTAIEVALAPAQYLSENDILTGETNQKLVIVRDGAAAKFVGSYQTGSSPLNLSGVSPATVFDPHSYYDYAPETANATLESKIKAQAGWQNVAWPK